jgi:hypothetical protein
MKLGRTAERYPEVAARWRRLEISRKRSSSGRKKGFELPFRQLAHWCAADRWPDEMLDAISARRVFSTGRMVEAVWKTFVAGRTTWSRVWALIVLTHWIDVNL